MPAGEQSQPSWGLVWPGRGAGSGGCSLAQHRDKGHISGKTQLGGTQTAVLEDPSRGARQPRAGNGGRLSIGLSSGRRPERAQSGVTERRLGAVFLRGIHEQFLRVLSASPQQA